MSSTDRLWKVPQIVFGFRERVSRTTYLGFGLALMALKFFLERRCFQMAGVEFGLSDFLTPFALRDGWLFHQSAAHFADLALNLPFLWIGLSMTARRAMDARLAPLWGFLFLIPGLHYVAMAAFSILPSRAVHMGGPALPGSYREAPREPTPATREIAAPPPEIVHVGQAVVFGALTCAAVGGVALWLQHEALGAPLLGVPAGLVAGRLAYAASRHGERPDGGASYPGERQSTAGLGARESTTAAPPRDGRAVELSAAKTRGRAGCLVVLALIALVAFFVLGSFAYTAVGPYGLMFVLLIIVSFLTSVLPVALAGTAVATALGAFGQARLDVEEPLEQTPEPRAHAPKSGRSKHLRFARGPVATPPTKPPTAGPPSKLDERAATERAGDDEEQAEEEARAAQADTAMSRPKRSM